MPFGITLDFGKNYPFFHIRVQAPWLLGSVGSNQCSVAFSTVSCTDAYGKVDIWTYDANAPAMNVTVENLTCEQLQQ